jgi:hypothetical protein
MRCGEARAAAQALEACGEQTRALRRDVVAAQHRSAATDAAADPGSRKAEKATAHEVYLRAQQQAGSDAERMEAAATWARALDRVNRAGHLAARAAARAKAEVATLEGALREAERLERSARFGFEAAEATCLEARVRLASCEEHLAFPATPGQPTMSEPYAAIGGHAVQLSETPIGEPLVIESMVSGDRRALELAAGAIAEHGRLSAAEVRLQLQELVDAVRSAASTEGYLIFDDRHPFWAHLSVIEARDIVAALGRLGFRFEPAEGWHAGRAPTPADLSMALAYAGLDARNMRGLPSVAELRDLPASIGVDARAYLVALAPDLAVDRLVRLLEGRADTLGPLWDIWGQVRPVMLSPRRALGSLPG